MQTQQVEPFYLIGIEVRTTNENGQSGKDIPTLWQRFMSDAIMEKIPSKTNSDIICVYADYEKDHTRPYTTVLGCKVDSLDTIPPGMRGITIGGGTYTKRVAAGNVLQKSVYNEWELIWNSTIPRTFTADFEVYGQKAWDPENGEVEIFVAI
ncbi:MAG: AraC family transcriptional regulator [Chitinophagaceae bacterium]|nr:MAG: AraC family transcriptional regulator [Chitinophagaceae bacterium]